MFITCSIKSCEHVNSQLLWVLHKLDIKRINAFEIKCKILSIHWIDHRKNSSKLNEFHLQTNCLRNFVRRQTLKYVGQVTKAQWFTEDSNARIGSSEMKCSEEIHLRP